MHQILEPCGLLPSTLTCPRRAGNIRVSAGSCFCMRLASSPIAPSALSVSPPHPTPPHTPAAFGGWQRFALPWGAFGAPGLRFLGRIWICRFKLKTRNILSFSGSGNGSTQKGSQNEPQAAYCGHSSLRARKLPNFVVFVSVVCDF